MKNLILAIVLLFVLAFTSHAVAQVAPQFSRSFTAASATNSADIIYPSGLDYFKLSYNSRDTAPSACSVRVMGSLNGTTYPATIIAATTCTSDGFTVITAGGTAFSHARIEVTSYTNPNKDTTFTLDGWKEVPGGTSTNPLFTNNSSSTTDPEYIRIQDGDGTGLADVVGFLANVSSGTALLTTSGLIANYQGIGSFLQTAGHSSGDADNGAGVFQSAVRIWNGSGFSRLYNSAAAANTTGTGLLGVNSLVFDGTNYQVQKGIGAVTSSNTASTGVAGTALIGKYLTAANQITATTGSYLANPSNINGVQIVATGPSDGTDGVTATSALATSTIVVSPITTVKASPGNVYGYTFYNGHSAVCFIQVFDATAPTVGTTVPVITLPIPATGGSNLISSVALRSFTTAITMASTTTATGSTPCTVATAGTIFFK